MSARNPANRPVAAIRPKAGTGVPLPDNKPANQTHPPYDPAAFLAQKLKEGYIPAVVDEKKRPVILGQPARGIMLDVLTGQEIPSFRAIDGQKYIMLDAEVTMMSGLKHRLYLNVCYDPVGEDRYKQFSRTRNGWISTTPSDMGTEVHFKRYPKQDANSQCSDEE